jgi:stage III sporulation protein SpoIIIAA
MMVGNMDEEGKAQGRVLREAVKNHTPQAIVIDEISTKAEVSVVKSIAERGIFMVGFLKCIGHTNVIRISRVGVKVRGAHWGTCSRPC